MKTVTSFNTDGTTTTYLCSEDEYGNLWIKDCPDNRRVLGLDPTGHEAKAIFGSCFVPTNGCEREARENSINYYTGEGENFVVGENPNAGTASKLEALRRRVLVDSELASRVEDAISELVG